MKSMLKKKLSLTIKSKDVLSKIEKQEFNPFIFIDIDTIIFNQKKLNHFFMDKIKYIFERLINHQIPIMLFSEHPIHVIEDIFNNTQPMIASTQGMQIKLNPHKLVINEINPQRVSQLLSDLQQRCIRYSDLKLRSDDKCICLKYSLNSSFHSELPQLILSLRNLYPEFKTVLHQDRLLFIPYQADKDFVIDVVLKNLPIKQVLPVYIGHDLNDFSGFSAVKKLQGICIKLGYGKSNAAYRFTDVSDIFDFLDGLLSQESVQHYDLDLGHFQHSPAPKAISI